MEEKTTGVFTSAMTRRELILTLVWLPIHLLVLPRLAMMLMEKNVIGESQANLLIYGVGALYMVVSCFGFLRREFDPLCENLLFCLVQIALSYCMMMGFNLCISGILTGVEALLGNGITENLNNEAIMDLARTDSRAITAMAGYAIDDPSYWLYTIQYLPAAYLLCRCYERTNSIWCSIFFHMLVNHISMRMLTILEELL